MSQLHYISPSLLPSRSANSVHVIHQCNGFANAGAEIILYAKRAQPKVDELTLQIKHNYGVDSRNWKLITFHSTISYADTFRIALMSARYVARAPRTDIVLSRNLHAAWLMASARRPFLFETHQLEHGIRKAMQRWVMTRPWVRTIAISNCLVTCLEEHHSLRLRDPLILHDAAPSGIKRLPPESRRHSLAGILKMIPNELAHWDAICGYFGQLFDGRGIDIIIEMAAARPCCLFLVFGGSESDVDTRSKNAPSNLRYMGHVTHPVSRSAQAAVDILLMPYQRSVSIGIKGQDTARWMSPMKMFEYLAAGVPIISSNLPVLKEVLTNEKNAILVDPDNIVQWVEALDLLTFNPEYANLIGQLAHQQYLDKHTWMRRAEALLVAGNDL
jgi:glycosyltransferase involved in cell wall biosynthesis